MKRRGADSARSSLLGSFRPSCAFYSVVILLRRFVLIALLTFITQSLYVWLTLANNAFLVLHMLLWPYRHAADSWLELLTLSAPSFQTTLLAVESVP